MLPKFLLRYLFRAEPQLSILGTIPAALLSILCLSHLVLTVSIHPFSASHISSNQNGFSWIVWSRISGKIHRGEWSEMLQFRWCTLQTWLTTHYLLDFYLVSPILNPHSWKKISKWLVNCWYLYLNWCNYSPLSLSL